MEELKVKANSYAEDNVINVLKEAFAKVYADGYCDGYKDRDKEIPVDLRTNQTKYIDLGLPSGTLWSTEYEREGEEILYLPYGKAELFSIPTKEQWEELVNPDICKWEYDKSGEFTEAYCIGPNGMVLKFLLTGLIHTSNPKEMDSAYFWIKDMKDGNAKNAIRIFNYYIQRRWSTTKCIIDIFSGYKLPIRLVKTK